MKQETNKKEWHSRLDSIYRNPTYQTLLRRLKELEKDRIYCKHDEEHFLAVGRIAYIKCLEQSLPVSKELLFCAAFFHDIGKVDQYAENTPHEIASKEYAGAILQQEGFSQEEIAFVGKLILEHRKGPELEDKISQIFYEADKESRNCFCCSAADTCNWPEEKKNNKIGKTDENRKQKF